MTSAEAAAARRRNRILHAAERLLNQYGPQKTTIADIAREASIGVGSVYLVFPSKEAIIHELSRSRYDHVLDAMREATRKPTSFADRFKAVMIARTKTFLFRCADGAHGKDLLHCASDAVRAVHARYLDEEVRLVASLLRDAASELELKRPDALAATVVRAYASFVPPWLFATPAEETLRAVDQMNELVLRGLLKRRRA